jgi:chloramphenicol O-acetyltransferase
MLPYYYNNNQQFLQKNLDPKVFKETTIFEKAEIKWVCVDDLLKIKKQFRSFYQNIIDNIYREKSNIYEFMKKPKKEKYFILKSPSKTRKNKLN